MSKRSKCEVYFKSGSELWLTKIGKLQILYMPGRVDGVKILLQLVWNERISAAAASPQCLQWFFPHAPCCHGCGCSLFHWPSPFHQQLKQPRGKGIKWFFTILSVTWRVEFLCQRLLLLLMDPRCFKANARPPIHKTGLTCCFKSCTSRMSF